MTSQGKTAFRPSAMRAAALLTPEEMAEADRLTIAGGIPGIDLMEAAGKGIADVISRRCPPREVLVLAGPGNNGGDGFVVARLLAERGWPVRLALLGARSRLRGDAAVAADRWAGPVEPLSPDLVDGAAVVVDALFGAGLSRDLDGVAAAVIARVAARAGEGALLSVAVDVPSGVDGGSGQVRGVAAQADVTVTFFRRKPGHLLLPGRDLCGDVRVIDIGICPSVVDRIGPTQAVNDPALWREALPRRASGDHKYRRGHVVVSAGPMTGAARLAAAAARRVGAGLLTIVSPTDLADIFRGDAAGAIVAPAADGAAFEREIADPRKNAILVGPGAGVGDATRGRALAALATGRSTVLDADAITVFAGEPDRLRDAIRGPTVLTPHEGEFVRLFPGLTGSKLDRARQAAARLGAVIVLKGADSVIAGPDGNALINENAPPWLATGGTGDVLAGTVLGLIGQGVPAFEAAAAGVWLNGEAARSVGAGLLADDLPDRLSSALAAALATPLRR